MATSKSLIPVERIEKSILLIRGHKVILDSDLAELYGVTTARLNEQVRRNKERFPKDFGFQLTQKEFEASISTLLFRYYNLNSIDRVPHTPSSACGVSRPLTFRL